MDISEKDIQAIQMYFPDCAFGDVGSQEALKRTSTCDVHACPGSGKTTLLVAKLAILARKSDWRSEGICVLSHTNVARLEVEKRLSRHPSIHDLLSYPHFIGTIQSFVDRFLALPYLRNKGIEVFTVDNDRFVQRARSVVLQYPQAHGWLIRHPNKDYLGQLRYEGASLRLSTSIGSLPVGESTNTYKQLSCLKKRVSDGEGIFRFDDMYAFAEAYINEYPFAINALTKRFPWVFIDEMQDTNKIQERLLERIFGAKCIVQRFGDVNQAIYSGEEDPDGQESFPRVDVIDLPESWRFGPEIAALTSNLTVRKKQTLAGRFESSNHHTIFLFGNETIQGVLPSFAELVLNMHNRRLPDGFTVKAIGFRRSGTNSDPKKIPFNIGDYWGEFRADLVAGSVNPSTFLAYVAKARQLVKETAELRDAYGVVFTGILRLLHMEGDRDADGKRFNNGRLLDTLETAEGTGPFHRLITALCVHSGRIDQEYWENTCDDLLRLRSLWDSRPLSLEGRDFLRWEEGGQLQNGAAGSPEALTNVFHYRGVDIEVGTIHGVKGETHGATLILETFMRTHDLKALLPYLSGERDVGAAAHDRGLAHRMQPIFVGMTRPRNLVCLAAHRDHVSEKYLTILGALGWRIQDI